MNPCEDKSLEEVTRKAMELGIVKKGRFYTCSMAKRDSACTALPKLAKMLCANTCKKCDVPKPATWCHIAGDTVACR